MYRFRRLRRDGRIRSMMQETRLHPKDLIYPIFVIEGEQIRNPVDSMPGVFQYSVDCLDEILDRVKEAGIGGVMLFGIPARKDPQGSQAYASDGVTQRAVRYMKEHYPEIYIVVDICLCEYTSHGHCGMVCGEEILNDETLPYLVKMAVSLVEAGADMAAPSDMMDGRVAAIREGLDRAGFTQTPIMAYSAKFASAYYGPFRDAAHSAPGFGDRKSYQMDCANGQEALREIRADIEEGADIVMVKPALAYLDVLKEAALTFDMPLAVYNVSGEYAMVKAAAANGWIDERRIVLENLTAMKRAGAKIIITYHALEAAAWEKDR
ncbi:MAG: porphobilinogen synthase [Lachnospiraceae bacterium]|nr:porphobilinogen synthase [Lachnospiraceae bacterium]